MNKRRVFHSAVETLSHLAPTFVAQLAWVLFCTPLVASRPTESQARQLSLAQKRPIRFGRRHLNVYTWGDTGPIILAAHGWGGRAHVFGDLIPTLVSTGFRVVSFDAPGHRRLGQRTNMLEYSSAIRLVARRIGPVLGIIGHSFGAYTVAYTAPLLPDIEGVALIGAPDRLDFMLDYAQEMLTLPNLIMESLERRIEKLSGMPVEEHSVKAYLKGSTFPKLLIHDTDDKDVPVERARNLVDQIDASYEETTGFGHHRILQSEVVATKLAKFFNSSLGYRDNGG